MKILLIHAPIFFRTEERNILEDTSNAAPPLGLAYLASMVKDYADLEILDAQGLSEKEVLDRIHTSCVDVVGISATSASAKNAYKISQWAKGHDQRILTILGGPHITAAPEETMEMFNTIDVGVIGDGEMIFQDLIRRILNKGDWRDIPGVAYRENAGEVKINPQGISNSLDEIPFPAWHLLPSFKKYSFNPSAYLRKPHCIVIASRGCPYSCIFCHVSRFRSKVRFRSAKNVVDELEILTKKFGIKEVRFGDELFAVNKEWAAQICSEIRARKLDIVWTCEARADTMTPEFARILKEGGCWQVTMGVESGSPRILQRIKKQITLEQVKNAVRFAHEAGLSARAFFMIGFPFEEKSDIVKTIHFSIDSGVDFASFAYVVPFPGTELYEMCVRLGYFDKFGWMNFDSVLNKPGCIPKGMDEKEITSLFKQAYSRFYFRPKHWCKTLGRIRTSEDIKKLIRGARVLFQI